MDALVIATSCILAWTGEASQSGASGIVPANLRCEQLANPVGIDTSVPRLSWELVESGSQSHGLKQSAYRILVASSRELLDGGEGDLWDSGKIDSDENLFIGYGGRSLKPDTTYFWKVQVWDGNDLPGMPCAPARFDTGLRTPADWKEADWIAWRPEALWRETWKTRKEKEFAAPKGPGDGFPFLTQSALDIFQLWRFHEPPYDPAPLFRKAFAIDRPVRRAMAYICGLGYYELSLNGCRVGDRCLDPAWTDYSTRVCYASYDVTRRLQHGENAVGVMLGRGFYGLLANDKWGFQDSTWLGQPKLLFRLSIEYVDGTKADIVSGTGWKVVGGPIVFDCPRRGEIYDARREIKGWDAPVFDDATWDSAVAAPAPTGELVSQFLPPIRACEEVRPVSMSNPQPGVYVFDLGRNIAGWPRLKLSGPAGTEILVRYSESEPSKELKLNRSYQQHGFILSGDGVETLEPRFCYTGFRYAVVSGASSPLTLDDLTGIHVHTDLADAGEFECSNPLLNEIHRAVRLTQLNNSHSIPTDCPHREKMGWGADAMVASDTAIYNFDMATFYAKWAGDVWKSQGDSGGTTSYSPAPKHAMGATVFSPVWGASGLAIPWNVYLYYGDRRVLETYYDAMKRYVVALGKSTSIDGEPYLVRDPFGDWAPPKDGQPPANQGEHPLVSKEGKIIYGTAYYYDSVCKLERISSVLGETEDAARYAGLAEKIRDAFNRFFYDPSAGCYRGEVRQITEYRQSANAVPLALGLVPDDKRPVVVKNLLSDLEKRNYRLNTGILGTRALMEVLASAGNGDAAYRVSAQTESPGWGHMIRAGSTTIWEQWDGTSSLDHPALGSIGAYFYRGLAGIQPDPKHPGFKHFFLSPTFVGGLDFVRAQYHSPYGVIESRWERKRGLVIWTVTIPPNTTAEVRVPTSCPDSVQIDGQPAKKTPGIGYQHDETGAVSFTIPSGSYRIETSDKTGE